MHGDTVGAKTAATLVSAGDALPSIGPSPASGVALVATTQEIEAALRDVVAACPSQLPASLRAVLTAAQSTLERPEVQIAVAGLFKAGKSTLLNAIVGRELLPHQEMPETGAPIWLRKGDADAAHYTDHAGLTHSIAPTIEALSEATSLYDAEGNRRPLSALAREVEIRLASWPLPDHIVLIDLPGLRDTVELDRLSLSIARQADLVIWLFRSEPAFSEQDAAALGYLVAMCGNHVVQLALNAFRPEKSLRAWRQFLKRRLRVQRTRLGEFAGEIGLVPRHIETMLVVDSRRVRDGWFWTFGGRSLFAVLRGSARRDAAIVKLARYPRVVTTLSEVRNWLAPAQAETAQRLLNAQHLYEVHSAEINRRRALIEKCRDEFSSSYEGLVEDVNSVIRRALEHVDQLSATTGGDAAIFFVDTLSEILTHRSARLALNLTDIGTVDVSLNFSAREVLSLIETWQGLSDLHSIDEIAAAKRDSFADALGPLYVEPPQVTAKGIWGRITGAKRIVPDDTSDVKEAIRQFGRTTASEHIARRGQVSKMLAEILDVPEKPSPPIPDATLHVSLIRLDETMTRIEALLSGAKK